jgi:hypothetical protein
MAFEFIETDEGFHVNAADGRAVAHVYCRTVGETNDPNLRVQKREVTAWPREKWHVHFTGRRLTLGELGQFLDEVAQQQSGPPADVPPK